MTVHQLSVAGFDWPIYYDDVTGKLGLKTNSPFYTHLTIGDPNGYHDHGHFGVNGDTECWIIAAVANPDVQAFMGVNGGGVAMGANTSHDVCIQAGRADGQPPYCENFLILRKVGHIEALKPLHVGPKVATISGAAGVINAYRAGDARIVAKVTGGAEGVLGANSAGVFVASTTSNDLFLGSSGGMRYAVKAAGNFEPMLDNAYYMGGPYARLAGIYLGTSPNVSSDARLKTKPQPLTDAEMAASKDISEAIGTYQFLSEVEKEGDAARLHIGVTVQRCMQIMRKHKLDPFRYAFICKHKGRYSLLMDELKFFLARGLSARLARLERLGAR